MTDQERSAREVDAILAAALERSPEELDDFLAGACAGLPELRAEVEHLLELAHAPDPFLGRRQGLTERLLDPGEETATRLSLPREVGPYRPVDEIGRGGMGVVYLAERADGEFEQRVALKVVREELVTVETVDRFRRERQILAGLDHPNIARLLDGGVDALGRLYFALELVEGERITEYADRLRLTVDERIDLVVTVAEAVQHAHRRLIVHRDLKPSNILVTARGQVKLLDFGIAKVLAPPEEGTASEEATQTVHRRMTPEYASPEQFRGEVRTTATDVYQLGVLLYKLLAGDRPYRFDDSSPLTIERTLSSTDPPRPSTVLAREDPAVQRQVGIARSTTPASLRRQLRGDLDNILLKAVDLDPDRRYGAAGQLADDLRRSRAGLPVGARPSGVGYRLSRFVARHRVGVAASLTILALLVGYAATVTYQSRALAEERDRARAEGRRAEEVSRFLVDLFQFADPNRSRSRKMTARELVDLGADRLDRQLVDQPALRAALADTLGEVYGALGLLGRAAALHETAVELNRELYGRDHPKTAASLARLGDVESQRGHLERAEALQLEARAIRERALGPRHPEVAESISLLAEVHYHRTDLVEADRLTREAIEIQRETGADDDPVLEAMLFHRAIFDRVRGRLGEARAGYERAFQYYRARYGDDHPDLLLIRSHLAGIRATDGDYEATADLHREALAFSLGVLEADHPYVAGVQNSLAIALAESGRPREALSLLESSLASYEKAFGSEHAKVASTLTNLGWAAQLAGRPHEAERHYEKSLAIYGALTPPHGQGIAIGELMLGRLLSEVGRPETGEPLLRSSLAGHREFYGAESPFTIEVEIALASCRAAQGDVVPAERLLLAALERLEPEAKERRLALEALVDLYDPGRPEEASRYRADLDALGR